MKEEDLLKFFNSVGEVVLHIFPKDRNNGLLRNFCFITYKSVDLVFFLVSRHVLDRKAAAGWLHDVQRSQAVR